jgi:tetratricopeptide (TPR) repeat protein
MKKIAGNREIAYKSEDFNAGTENYRKNMDRLLKKAGREGIPVFISEICSNVRDLKPFCSVPDDNYPLASSVYQEAMENENSGKFNQAYALFNSARDLDCIRFRAPGEMNEIIRDLALKHKSYLVPTNSEYFEASSPNRLVGDNLMTEHVHPNIEGYFLLADAFFNALASSGVLGAAAGTIYYKNSSYYQRNWGYTELDSLTAVHVVNLLKTNWPFQSLASSSDDYRNHYRPSTLVDSLAFGIASSPLFSMEDGHNTLAEYYLSKADFYKAFKEYYANLKYNPYNVNYYNQAIHCLTFINDFTLALKLAEESLALQESVYALYIKGEILFLQGDYAGAVLALTRASEFGNSRETEFQIMQSLHKVYYYAGDSVRVKKIRRQIEKTDPEFQPVYPAEKKEYALYIPRQVEGQVNQAYEFYATGNFERALPAFLESLKIKETSLANKCIGDILFIRGDSSALVYYQKAFPDYRNNVTVLYKMAQLYAGFRQTSEARKMLEVIKMVDPGSEKIPLLEQAINKIAV